MRSIVCGFLFLLSSYAWSAVSGQRVESLGVTGTSATLGQWLGGGHALFTPETANLAVQACLREAQPIADTAAYPSFHGLTNALKARFEAPSSEVFPSALSKLAEVAQAIDNIPIAPRENADDYTRDCTERIEPLFTADRDILYPLFAGRMAPKPDPLLQKKGLELVPLTWRSLASTTCQLEGQTASTFSPEQWKSFSLTRLFGSVLPQDDQSNAFEAALAEAPEIGQLLDRIDNYDSIAGKSNGTAIAFSSGRGGTLRFTGPAAGSRAPSLLATFTTGWREGLQRQISSQAYPAKPFALLNSSEILGALEATEKDTTRESFDQSSQTEIGMTLAWSLLSPSQWSLPPNYGPETSTFRTQATLAWLAMNAETNLRQNEKLPGIRHSALSTGTVSIWGDPDAYLAVAHSLDSASSRLEVFLQGNSLPSCVSEMSTLLSSARTVPLGEIGKLSPAATTQLGKLPFTPAYADIGLEVEDPQDGIFRLGLATGNGHVTEANIEGTSYELWSPSALVLHTPKVITTTEWQGSLVETYDPK